MSGALVIKRFNMIAKFDFYFDQELLFVFTIAMILAFDENHCSELTKSHTTRPEMPIFKSCCFQE